MEDKATIHETRNGLRVMAGWINVHRLYFTLRAVLLIAAGCLFVFMSSANASAFPTPQNTPRDTTTTWTLFVDGAKTIWPTAPPNVPVDSARVAGTRVVQSMRRDGFYTAQLDSVVLDTSATPPDVAVYVTRGPEVVLGTIQVRGGDSLGRNRITEMLDLPTGRPLTEDQLHARINNILTAHEELGYPVAEVRIDSIWIDDSSRPPELGIGVTVESGPRLWLKRIILPPGTRTSPRFVARLGGLQLGEPLRNYDPVRLRESLQQTAVFDSVGTPRLRTDSDGGATLFVPVRDMSPGTFDVLLGYLPGSDGDGQLIGTGRLALRNVFGAGRQLRLSLDRRPEQVSLLDVRVIDPFVAGRPIRVELAFKGEQRDSTFSERTYRASVGLQPKPTWSLSLTGSREVLRPGQGGTMIVRGEQQIPRATSLFYGLSAQVQRLNDRQNPRRGVEAEIIVEQGRKRRSLRQVIDADTVAQSETLRQERIITTGRLYIPTFKRQLVAFGADAQFLRSDEYDGSDLFQFGGSRSLRGYDEDRYAGRITLRGLVEYRVQIDPSSYAFAFLDVGFVDTPETAELNEAQHVLPGYGVGLQFGTPLGLANVSYALQPSESPAQGRVHLGLSFGL